jgi:hypothetical protein
VTFGHATARATSEHDATQPDIGLSGVFEGPDGPSGTPPPSAAVEYMLVHNSTQIPIAGNGQGWTLIARYDGWCWSTALAARGAGAHAAVRVAQAVAVRVLAEQGVAVTSWSIVAPDTEALDC